VRTVVVLKAIAGQVKVVLKLDIAPARYPELLCRGTGQGKLAEMAGAVSLPLIMAQAVPNSLND
jgi:hypothetical protein